MIYTLTLNGAVDYTVFLSENLKIGGDNRASSAHICAGGKGINCAVMLKRLGQDAAALGFAGGVTGDIIKSCLYDEGVECLLTQTHCATRINVKVMFDGMTEIGGISGSITEGELYDVFEKLSDISSDDILVLSGSIPPGADPHIYKTIVENAFGKNISTVLDIPGKAIAECLNYRPMLIKPNLSELEDIFGNCIKSTEEVKEKAKELCRMGAMAALVSLGGDGAVLALENGDVYSSPAVPVKVKSAVGSGDSMVAGYIVGNLLSGEPEKALRMAIAAGSATASCTGLAPKEKVEELYEVTRGTVKKE